MNWHLSQFCRFVSNFEYTDVIEVDQRISLNRNHSFENLSRGKCMQFDSAEKHENKRGEGLVETVSRNHLQVQILQLFSGGIERFPKFWQWFRGEIDWRQQCKCGFHRMSKNDTGTIQRYLMAFNVFVRKVLTLIRMVFSCFVGVELLQWSRSFFRRWADCSW